MAGFATGMSTHADMFLKIDGVEGESPDKDHKKEIQILSFNFGATQPGSAGFGGGSGVGKVQLHDFQFSKYTDSATPKLFEFCATGKHTPTVTLTCRKAGGSQQEYFKVKMSDVIVSSISHAGSGGEALPVESISLNFSKIEMEYKPQDEKGGLGGVIKAGWNALENAKI
ncbi:MAG TPA: type VI secretion system tube protein Hcp [Candidatus Acidoferrum sp.]